jgi:hypothetical protein
VLIYVNGRLIWVKTENLILSIQVRSTLGSGSLQVGRTAQSFWSEEAFHRNGLGHHVRRPALEAGDIGDFRDAILDARTDCGSAHGYLTSASFETFDPDQSAKASRHTQLVPMRAGIYLRPDIEDFAMG